MNLETNKYLYDIKDSVRMIESYLGLKRNFNEFKSDMYLQDAVMRRLEIIGEAVNRILKSNPEIKISEPRKIVAFRNKIAHEYDSITIEYVWAVLSKNLPVLKTEVEALLKNE